VKAKQIMKTIKHLLAVALAAFISGLPLFGVAADDKNVKPYKLDTCAVSDEKLGDMGKPYSFEHNGQEFKLCCKSCKKDFDKDPAKYVKKFEQKQKNAATKK
jgi:YHS domain-containing protein